ncbi:hypothetical protein [Pseudochrobactrum asaccharolyticum]|uniref:hypothetical protein n=1 Tax=Pseudochrobactrum asaccharolyticum TaxID=354351 RepID=UPI004041DCF0
MSLVQKNHSVVLSKVKRILMTGVSMGALCFIATPSLVFAQSFPQNINPVSSPVLGDLVNKGGVVTHTLPPVNGANGKDAHVEIVIPPKRIEATAGISGDNGSSFTVNGSGTRSEDGQNIFLAGSTGGAGGKGGSVGRLMKGDGADGGNGGDGGNVSLNTTGDLSVYNGSALVVFSNGGQGGKGGDGTAVTGTIKSGAGGNGGNAGQINITNEAQLATSGNQSFGIFAQAAGGHGGKAGDADGDIAKALAAKSGDGGRGGTVVISNKNNITTVGAGSDAIHGLSLGGNGADAAEAKSLTGSATNGVAGNGGDAGTVAISSDKIVSTQGAQSNGLVGKSVGGKGGNGNNVTPGGSVDTTTAGGGHGGNGGGVNITNDGFVTITNGHAIYAESTGGAGGTSGSSVAALSKTKSGNGGNGGNAGAVDVENNGVITTKNASSSAVVAVSTGGQGGSANYGAGLRQAEAGSGGNGGNGGTVSVNNQSSISTQGNNSNAIIAASTGGNGGHGGWAGAATDATSGNGGAGGNGAKAEFTNSSIIKTQGDHSTAVIVSSAGGTGGNGGFSVGGGVAASGSGGQGGHGSEVSATNSQTIETTGANSAGLVAASSGGKGGNAGWSIAVGKATSGDGGKGGSGGKVTVTNDKLVTTEGDSSTAVIASSAGGTGGNGGFSVGGGVTTSGNGGQGGQGGAVDVTNTGDLLTKGNASGGVVATSLGGAGGNSGWSVGVGNATSGSGGTGGTAANVTVDNQGKITTQGEHSNAVTAVSAGGQGGNAGFSASGGVASSGSGGNGGNAGAVDVKNAGTVTTNGASSSALVAVSQGGNGGNAGWSAAIGKATSGKGGDGGNAGSVTATNSGALETKGASSSAVIATSDGGKGGAGGVAGSVYAGDQGGGAGGKADRVTVVNDGDISTAQSSSLGIVAQSNGGAGGNGGFHLSIASKGGDGGEGGAAGAVSVTNNKSIKTGIAAQDEDSSGVTGSAAIVAQSLGGQGGKSGSNVTVAPLVSGSAGGTGGAGGDAGTVNVTTGVNSSTITYGDQSAAIIAQSIGGQGGKGELTVSVAAGPGAGAGALGTIGGKGGDGAKVTIDTAGVITTHGNDSIAVLASSVGGEGGEGGLTITGAGSTTASIAGSVAREGGAGGNAGEVSVINAAAISTSGNQSSAIAALSAGGKGGKGGTAGDLNIALMAGGSVSVAGAGGAGGDADKTVVRNTGEINTKGDGSAGILAQSAGGAGGDGGKAMALSLGTGGSLSASIGGKGGVGGNAGQVGVENEGKIITQGNGSSAIIAESLGGKGGQGEGNGTGGLTSGASLTVAGGHDGGTGGQAAAVSVVNKGDLTTTGHNAAGISAISQGGAGGDGGNAVSIAVAAAGSVAGAWSGKGGAGGDAAGVTITNSASLIKTEGANSSAIEAQSNGGKGGAAGLAGAAGFAAFTSTPTGAVSVGFGQAGGDGGAAGNVVVQSQSAADLPAEDIITIQTRGDGSRGILAQSLGGSGDSGGMAGALSGSLGPTTLDAAVAIGGNGGAGADAGTITVTSFDHILTSGNQASGIEAVSQGGAGGNGGGAGVAALEAAINAKSYGGMAAIGGTGGNGGAGADSQVEFNGWIVTGGEGSHGIRSASVGGKGGDAGNTLSAGIGFTPDAANIAGSVGGAGGKGGAAGDASVDFTGEIFTNGKNAHGILAESLGGEGGKGALNIAGAAGHIGATNGAGSWGRVAGDGGVAGNVNIDTLGVLVTKGDGSDALVARSVGGQGGAAQQALSGTAGAQSASSNTNGSLAVAGNGGNGTEAGTVTVNNQAHIYTGGQDARAIAALSEGGAGGNGGTAIAGAANLAGINEGQLRIGLVSIAGSGRHGADGGVVDVTNSGEIYTVGANSAGLQAYSLGGNGGKGGDADVAHALFKVEVPNIEESPSASTYQLLVGGAGGRGGDSAQVLVKNQNEIVTMGAGSAGIDAQSLGGAGGDGGSSKLLFSADDIPYDPIKELIDKDAGHLIVGTGGTGGAGGDGADVIVANQGAIFTYGDAAAGILARSVGGKGGNSGDGGLSDGSLGIGGGALTELIRSIGENTQTQSAILDQLFAWADDVGTGGDAGAVSVTNGVAGDMLAGTIQTSGDNSAALVAETAGGAGGNGGNGFGKIALGGDGGRAGHAGAVDVVNHASLATFGEQSAAIIARAQGGAGGRGGNASSGGDEQNAYLTFGGRGGAGGNAADVAVDNHGEIWTTGDGSQGILAQSLGGDGGASGDGQSKFAGLAGGALDQLARENLPWFGSAGAAGKGADVNVTNNALIYTEGDGSVAIQAESRGGTGGKGGSAGGIVSLVGDGSVGGNAGNVDVINHASLFTEGENATGIAARSQGGMGGAGGSIGSADALEGFVSIAGRGGAGGAASDVSVQNMGTIVTLGGGSAAIQAQSVGGTGGKAGDSNAKLIAVGGGSFDGLINTKADWYGRTGTGGAAGDVSITNGDAQNPNSAILATAGDNAGVIVAQSLGGHGGAGGDASGHIQFDVPFTTDYEAALGLAVAGDGGIAGNAGKVDIINNGLLISEGKNSAAITAQSIGGHGGAGGNAQAKGIATGDKTLLNLTVAAAGLAGSGGDADQVTVVNGGSIYTFADQSAGIIAESLGGAGGNGADVYVTNGIAGQNNEQLIYTAGNDAAAIIARSQGGNGSDGGGVSGTLTFGGNGGHAGDAGAVTVENHAALITKGNGSAGILAQSVGGNGGVATSGNLNVFHETSDGTGGDAGAVDISNSGVIVTTGDAAGAIVALSQGVNAAAVTINNTGDVVTTGAQSVGLSAQSLGKTSAGDVTVANSGSVMTNGTGSNALTARSVVEEEMLFASRMAPQATQSFASPEASFFLFDFVTAGGGQAGNVSVDHNGTLIAAGDGSSAIYAQSTGSTNGNIDIAVNADSLLVGGAAGGAGVTMIDGAQNSLVNHGTITALGDTIGYIPAADGALLGAGWIDGMAMQGTTGDTAISNTGLVVGNISMGSGTSTFTNTSDGWMVAGSQIGLGGQAGSLFTNAGVLSSGGVKTVQTTVIDGSFDQTETGKYLVDLDFAGGAADNLQRAAAVAAPSASGKADKLEVTGQANLGGHLPVNISNTGYAKSGQNDYVIVHAEGGVHDDGMQLEAPNTAVATFTLGYTQYETILGANIDYAARGLTENGIAVGNTINAIQFDQTSPAFRPLAEAIFAQPDIASLQRTYDLIDGEGTAGAQQAYFSDTNAFIGAVSQQTNLWSNPYRLGNAKTDRQCTLKNNVCVESLWRGWYSGFGSDTNLQGDPYVVGSGDLKSHSKGMAAGLDYELTKDLLLGFSVGMSKANFKVNDRLTQGDIETGRTAIYGAYRHNNLYIDGLFGVDWFNASTDRMAAILPTAGNAGFSDRLQNDFSGYGINARLETGYRMDLGGVQFSPFAALQLSSFHMNGSTESADVTGGDLALYYKGRTINSVPLSLGAQFDTRIELGGNAYFSPYVRAAWVHEFSNKRSVEAGFTAAPGYEFVVHGAAQARNSAQVEAGFNVQIETGLSLYGKVTGNFSGSDHDVSGSGGLRLRW